MTSGRPSAQRDGGMAPPWTGTGAVRSRAPGSPGQPPGATAPRTPAESAALVISRALGADGGDEPPVRRPSPVAAVLAALLVVAAASGYIAGSSGSSPPEPRTVEAGAARLDLPPGWERREPGAGIETVAARPLVAAPPGGGAQRIVAAELRRRGLGLMPRAAAARIEGASAGEPVSLGDVRATRYSAIESGGSRRRLNLFATPTARGTALVACAGSRAGDAGFMRRCQAVAATLSLAGGRKASELAAGDVATVDRALASLEARRASASRRLRRGGSRATRVSSVHSLAAAHARARSALTRLPKGSEARRAGAPVIRSLAGVERAYRGLARALRSRSRAREQAARREVRRRDAALRSAVERL